MADTDLTIRSVETHRLALRYVHTTINRQGFPPTVREIGNALGYRSPSSAAKIVEGLVRRGWLSHVPNRPRTIIVTAEGAAELTEDDRG